MAATQSSPLNVRSCLRIVQLSPACQEGPVQKHAIKDQHGLANVGGRRCGWQLGWGYIQGNTVNGLTAVVLFFFAGWVVCVVAVQGRKWQQGSTRLTATGLQSWYTFDLPLVVAVMGHKVHPGLGGRGWGGLNMWRRNQSR